MSQRWRDADNELVDINAKLQETGFPSFDAFKSLQEDRDNLMDMVLAEQQKVFNHSLDILQGLLDPHVYKLVLECLDHVQRHEDKFNDLVRDLKKELEASKIKIKQLEKMVNPEGNRTHPSMTVKYLGKVIADQ